MKLPEKWGLAFLLFSIQLSLNALVLVLCRGSGSVSAVYWFEVSHDRRLKAGVYVRTRTAPSRRIGWMNLCMLLRRQNANAFLQIVPKSG